MKTPFYILTATLALGGTVCSHASTGRPQSSAEMEDIGAIAESGAPAGDGKSTVDAKAPPPPPAASPFRFSVSTRTNYTSNARLSGNHASSDFIFFPTVEAGYHTALGKGFAFDSVARLESGVYAVHDERAFIGYSLTNTLEWRPRPNLPRVFIGVEPYRYDGFDGQGRITQAVGTSAGTDYGYAFNNGHSLLFVSYSFTDFFSDPGEDNRLSHSVVAGFAQQLSEKLTLQAFYQWVHDSFPTAQGRQDSRHIVGLTLNYQINQHFSASVGGSFVDNDSNRVRASYESLGVNLGLNYTF